MAQDITMKQATDILIEEIMNEIGLSKTEARKALAQVLTEYPVVEEIKRDIKEDLDIWEDESFDWTTEQW